jgi:CheY-like chemotaxis protein
MNAAISPLLEFDSNVTFDVTVRLDRLHNCRTTHGFTRLTATDQHSSACRAWPTARGFIYVVDTYPGLARLAKTILAAEGFSTCAFEDRATAWQAFAFANPRPALLITDNLDGNAAAMDLINRCRSVEPELKTLLIDLGFQSSQRILSQIDGRLPRSYCAPELIQAVRRLCSSRTTTGFNERLHFAGER